MKGPTNNALDRYRTDGYAVIRGVLAQAEVDDLQEEARRVLEESAALLGLPEAPGSELESSVLCVHQVHKLSPAITDLGRDSRLVEPLVSIIGEHVKLVQTQLFYKAPGMPGNPWHQDEAKIPTRDRSLVAVWVALDPASVESGCLLVVPGSHSTGYVYPERLHESPDRWDFPTTAYEFDESQVQALEVEPGDLVLFDGYLLHGSEPNRGQHLRRALTYHYMNAYSLFPWKVPSREPDAIVRPADADYRDVIMVAGEDPYAWKGYSDESTPHLRRTSIPLPTGA